MRGNKSPAVTATGRRGIYPKGMTVNRLVLGGNLAAGKTKAAREYLESLPGRFALHFIPTRLSWLNLVERWFSEITSKRIRQGDFRPVPELVKVARDYGETWNRSRRCFRWTKARKARSFL